MSEGTEEADGSQVYDALDYAKGIRTPATEYVAFSLHGLNYRIELGAKNLARLEKALQPFIGQAYSTFGAERHRPVSLGVDHYSQSRDHRARNQAIRKWAAENGWNLQPYGRIPDEVVQAFELDTRSTNSTTTTEE